MSEDAEREAYRRGALAAVKAIRPWRYGACPYSEDVSVPGCDWPLGCKPCWGRIVRRVAEGRR